MADDLERRTENIVKRFVDMGDGTFAEKVVAVNEDGTAIGGDGGAAQEVTLSDETLAAILTPEDMEHFSGDRGYAVLAVRQDAEGTMVGTDGDYSYLQVDSSGYLKVREATGGTGTHDPVANAIADAEVLPANANRKGATFYNDGDVGEANVYLALGFAASDAAFTVLLEPGDYYELPAGYTGAVRRYASAATGTLQVTELT